MGSSPWVIASSAWRGRVFDADESTWMLLSLVGCSEILNMIYAKQRIPPK
jgi:hypothetical protein